jgi:hypothetical protein
MIPLKKPSSLTITLTQTAHDAFKAEISGFHPLPYLFKYGETAAQAMINLVWEMLERVPYQVAHLARTEQIPKIEIQLLPSPSVTVCDPEPLEGVNAYELLGMLLAKVVAQEVQR